MISVIGGAINTDELKQILKSTYEKDKKDIGDYKIDKQLSGLRAKVYTNKETGKNVIAIRGTQGIHDMITDANLLFNNKNTKRFKHAKKVTIFSIFSMMRHPLLYYVIVVMNFFVHIMTVMMFLAFCNKYLMY